MSKYWAGHGKEEIFSTFDSVTRKVRKRKTPRWDMVVQ
jgi:hypothetical protein